MKQTAVGWLTDIFYANEGIMKSEWLEKAKEMEKQQIIDAANSENSVDINHGEQYYNETFKSE